MLNIATQAGAGMPAVPMLCDRCEVPVAPFHFVAGGVYNGRSCECARSSNPVPVREDSLHLVRCDGHAERMIRALAAEHDVAVYLDDVMVFSSDAAAKLIALTLAGDVLPTRVASCAADRQLWEFVIDGSLYLLATHGRYIKGFEPRDGSSFDRLLADLPDPDLHIFAAEAVAA